MQTRSQELPENAILARIARIEDQIEQLRTPQSIGVGGSGNGNGIITVSNASSVVISQSDVSGFHVYNASAQQVLLADLNGFHTYTAAGVEIARSDATGFHVYNNSAQQVLRADLTGFHALDANGNDVSRMDSSGVEIYGQGLSIFSSNPGGALKGYIGYGIQGGNGIVLAGGTGVGVTLLPDLSAGQGLGPGTVIYEAWFYGGFMRIPHSTSAPSNPVVGWMYFDESTNRLWVHNGIAWKSVTLA